MGGSPKCRLNMVFFEAAGFSAVKLASTGGAGTGVAIIGAPPLPDGSLCIPHADAGLTTPLHAPAPVGGPLDMPLHGHGHGFLPDLATRGFDVWTDLKDLGSELWETGRVLVHSAAPSQLVSANALGVA